jgi:hypothetical protein
MDARWDVSTLRLWAVCAGLIACASDRRIGNLQESLDSGMAQVAPHRDAARPCSWVPSQCVDFEDDLDVSGDSPHGPVHFTGVSVSYEDHLGMLTNLTFYGTRNGAHFQLLFRHREGAAAWPPGEYATGPEAARPGETFVSLTVCESDSELGPSAQVTIDRHERPGELPLGVRGISIRLGGTVTLDEPGWSLSLPFDLTAACEYNILLI